MWPFSRLRTSFARENLCGKRKRVDEEQLGEFFELFNLGGSELFVVVGTLIAIEANEVSPFLQISGELSIVGEEVNPFRQHLACKRWIKFTSGCINGLSEHGGRCISVSAASIVETLDERAFNRLRNARRSSEAVLLWILDNNRRFRLLYVSVEIAQERHHPICTVGRVEEADAKDFRASIAGERRRAACISFGNQCDWLHSHVGRAAMRAVSDKSYRHIHSMVTRDRAAWGEA